MFEKRDFKMKNCVFLLLVTCFDKCNFLSATDLFKSAFIFWKIYYVVLASE